MKLEKIIRQIESNNPAIGIGTATGATGILATRLIIKIAKKSKLKELKKESEKTKRKLAKLIREDIKAYKNYMEAYKSKDEEMIDKSLKYAIETPMKIAEQGYKILELSEIALEKGKKSLALESYGASALGSFTVSNAIRIINLNLESLKDERHKKELITKRDELTNKARSKKFEIYSRFSNNFINSYSLNKT